MQQQVSIKKKRIPACAITSFLALAIVMTGCKKERAAPCVPIAITADAVATDPCAAQGTITVLSPAGSDFRYSIHNGLYQTSPVFTGLTSGQYTLTVKDEKGCTGNRLTVVGQVSSGPLFTTVKALLAVNCTPCHFGNNPQAGLDWADNCTIVNNWARIKARAVDRNPSPMPQGGLLPLSERNKITNWIAAGHRFTD